MHVSKRLEMVEYRAANAQDIPKLLDFYHFMIDFVRESDIKLLWKRDSHPSDEFITEAVNEGDAFIGVESDSRQIACAVVLNEDAAPGYENVPWATRDLSGRAGVLHVLATHPEWRRQGLGRGILEFAVEEAKQRDYESIRLDTLTYNTPAKSLYSECGFDYLGDFPVDYGDFGIPEVSIYEKVLGSVVAHDI